MTKEEEDEEMNVLSCSEEKGPHEEKEGRGRLITTGENRDYRLKREKEERDRKKKEKEDRERTDFILGPEAPKNETWKVFQEKETEIEEELANTPTSVLVARLTEETT